MQAGGLRCLVPLAQAGEIFPWTTVQPVPYTHSWFLGVANLRGSEAGPVVRIPIEPREPLEAELSAFIDAIRDGAAMPVSAADALATLAIADALSESAATGRAVVPERGR